ncbi:MAG: hypothetical protein GY807_16875 [Gammaproteobacteria bacterium]|nr:hypothetical protein [Gammaproteobacteria bacterium]
MKKLIAAASVVCVVALAGCTATSPDDPAATENLTTSQIRSLLTGKTVRYDSGGVATYNTNGSYQYRGQGRTSLGQYSFRNNQVCVDFIGGNQRCDSFIKQGGSYYLVNGRGQQFRARIEG